MTLMRIHFTLPKHLLDEMDEVCDYNMLTRSGFLRRAIKHYLAYINDGGVA